MAVAVTTTETVAAIRLTVMVPLAVDEVLLTLTAGAVADVWIVSVRMANSKILPVRLRSVPSSFCKMYVCVNCEPTATLRLRGLGRAAICLLFVEYVRKELYSTLPLTWGPEFHREQGTCRGSFNLLDSRAWLSPRVDP